ncbi:MAG: hypothetical protein HUU57_16455 [Bdellovibrio sp.]|nr:hypothetical protein [Bdellovibrio sp.]
MQLSLSYSLLGVLIVSAGCNPSTTNYNQTIQPASPAGDPTKQGLQSGGPGSTGTTGGTGDGGGGQGVYCSETTSDKNLKGKLFVRDIYEAIKNHKRTMPSGKLGAGGTDTVDESAIKHFVEVLRKYYGPASGNLDFVNTEYWKKFADSISFIPEDATLHPSQDANSPLALPEGCKVVQIAYWDESSGPVEDGTLYVDKKTWKQLDQFNKIALLAHEFYFKQARKAGYKNSDFVRYKVGHLLSQEGLLDIFQQWEPSKDSRVKDVLPEKKTGFKYCTGTSEADPNAKLQMYQYEGKDQLQHIVFPVVKSNTVNFSDFQVAHVTFSKETHHKVSFLTDLLLPVSHYKQSLGSVNEGSFLLAFDELPLLSARYGDQTFIDASLGDSSISKYKDRILEMVSGSARDEEVSWTVKSRSESAKIQMFSPAFKRDEAQESVQSLSKDELVRAINNQIILGIFGDLMRSSEARRRELVLPSLNALHKELDEGMAAGVYPTGLPKWSGELKKIEQLFSNILTKEKGKPVKFFIKNNSDLLGSLPQKLYALKMNAYDGVEIMRGINNPELKKGHELPVSLRAGSVSITEGSNTATFKLECHDYVDVFKAKTNKKEYSENVDTVRLKGLRVIPEEQSEQEPGYANYLRHRDEFIKMISGNAEISKLETAKSCGWENQIVPQYCADLNSLLIDLREESVVEMQGCFGYAHTAIRDHDQLQTCRILNLKKAQQRYLVIFAYPHDQDYLQGRSSDPGEFSWVQVLRIP